MLAQVKELRKIVGDDIELCIAGNKCDLEKQRQVPEDEAEAYAVSVNATHYKVCIRKLKILTKCFSFVAVRPCMPVPFMFPCLSCRFSVRSGTIHIVYS
jgi:hypothetical protein